MGIGWFHRHKDDGNIIILSFGAEIYLVSGNIGSQLQSHLHMVQDFGLHIGEPGGIPYQGVELAHFNSTGLHRRLPLFSYNEIRSARKGSLGSAFRFSGANCPAWAM